MSAYRQRMAALARGEPKLEAHPDPAICELQLAVFDSDIIPASMAGAGLALRMRMAAAIPDIVLNETVGLNAVQPPAQPPTGEDTYWSETLHQIFKGVDRVHLPKTMAPSEQTRIRNGLKAVAMENSFFIRTHTFMKGDRCPGCALGHVKAVHLGTGKYITCCCGGGDQHLHEGPPQQKDYPRNDEQWQTYDPLTCPNCATPINNLQTQFLFHIDTWPETWKTVLGKQWRQW